MRWIGRACRGHATRWLIVEAPCRWPACGLPWPWRLALARNGWARSSC